MSFPRFVETLPWLGDARGADVVRHRNGLGSFGNFCFAMREAVASELLDARGVGIEFNSGVRGWSARAAVS